MLDTEESAARRERLIADIARLQSSDEAADWVHKNLPVKNTLTAFDAEAVEASFRERLGAIELASASENWSHATETKDGTEPTQTAPRFCRTVFRRIIGRSCGCADNPT